MKERKIEIMEVCPRDGWQNLPDVIPLEKKKQYIDHMLASGVKYMQICSFVNPKVIPQMADAQEVTRYFLEKYPDRCFNALIPNLRGAQTAVDCGLREVSFVVSASESHNMANVKRTIAQSLAALDEICEKLPQLDVTLSIATSFGCPFEGAVPPEKVLEMVRHGVDIGITMVFVPAVSTFVISRMLGGGSNLLIGDLIEMQFLGNSYNLNVGSAMSLVLMIIVLLCMSFTSSFDEDEMEGVS